ncbi:ASKHA domain-containing protein [Peptostreptococcus porci]|uniref:ASKHA domain-containing protein n=1 Tax=Peptostreptococcus porci TaxID=2652282 RepID=UPI002A91758F|nr:ASKHA domain-containing protein [Peptostreptococcus porci]MDY6230846.1 ASKHA domain-containing protein [Peptostreptococcus porci]
MPSIEVKNVKEKIEYRPNENLLDILLESGHFVDNPCNGKGTCGKCKVKIIDGAIESPSITERKLLSEGELESGVRLSCMVKPSGNLKVELMQKEREHKVLTAGYKPRFDFNTNIKKVLVQIEKPSLQNQTPFEEQLKKATGLKSIQFDNLQSIEYDDGAYTVVLYDEKVIGVEVGDTMESLYGLAVDIGTTTVVCELVDMNTGKELSNSSMINAQKHFGLDVLTRITYEIENKADGKQKLQEAIVKSINDMIEDICNKERISRKSIYEMVVSANCTMMHMLLGVSAKTIGKSPYAPIFTSSKNIPAIDIGIDISRFGRLHCLPSVSAYIGADIVSGAYVCNLENRKGNILFIDIGTNGEIVLSKSGRLLCCSCAAGPALEGMNISSGMRAADGAIEDIDIDERGNISLKVIGDKEPIGICGSGILAAIRELVKSRILKKDGAFIKLEKLEEDDFRNKLIQMNGKKREFVVYSNGKSDEKILITQGDVRQVQLAKGAILSGFLALLEKAEITMDELDKVVIAGQFGAHLPADSLTGTGILPDDISDKLEYVGNSSKVGAYMALMSKDVKENMEKLSLNMDYMELGAVKGYERLFSDCLIFPKV